MDLYNKFEENISSRFEGYYCHPIVKDILSKFVDIYFVVYEGYNERFKRVFKQELEFLFKIHLVVFDVFVSLIDNYERDIQEKISKKKMTQGEIYSRIKKTKIILFMSEPEMESYFKKIKGKSYLGLNKEALFDQISLHFYDIAYCIDVAENKNYLIDKYVKYSETINLAYHKWEDSKKTIKYSTALKQATNNDNYKSNSSDPLYQGFRNFIKTKKDLQQFKDQVKNRYQNSLQKLQ